MIYTLGHSVLCVDDFMKVVQPIDLILDIRSHPGSSKYPQFNKENMQEWVPRNGKEYAWEPRLGGWSKDHLHLQPEFQQFNVKLEPYSKGKFPKQRIADHVALEQSGPYWNNTGLWDYQFFLSLPDTMAATRELIENAKHKNIAIMCAEVLWWKCHRSMVADYLTYLDQDVFHLQPKLTLHRKALGNRIQRYHPYVLQKWRSYAAQS